MAHQCSNPPVGERDVAALLGVKEQTVRAWLWRGELPEPDHLVSGRPCWHQRTIERWWAKRRQS